MSIELRNVTHIYAPGTAMEELVLKDISLTIHDGEFVALIGPTGSGKSTLVQHLNMLLKATSGDILYNGESIYADGYNKKALRGKVGLVFQYPEYQLFESDVFTDVCFGPKNLGLDEETVKARAREALELVGLGPEYDERSPFELSGGQKRRVAIAGVLAMKPEVLILDEPAAGLDPGGKKELLDQFRRLHQETGLTIILVSHSMEDVAQYAERLIALHDGQVLFDGTPRQVFDHRDELRAIGLSVPQATEVAIMLRERGWDIEDDLITIEEVRDAILKIRKNV